MRLISFLPPTGGPPRAGAIVGAAVIDLPAAAPLVSEDAPDQPWDVSALLRGEQPDLSLAAVTDIAQAVIHVMGSDDLTGMAVSGFDWQHGLMIGETALVWPLDQIRLAVPLPSLTSLRDFEAFADDQTLALRQAAGYWSGDRHWPAFRFASHTMVFGPDQPIALPASGPLDCGLALGCVIGRAGRDIPAAEAAAYIAGYCLINAWTIRDPLLTSLRPRDVGTSCGPWLVTPDELEYYCDDDGRLMLSLRLLINQRLIAQINTASMRFSFAEMIAFASRDTTLLPGEVLCSGIASGGCLFDHHEGAGPYLQPGDEVIIECPELGQLRNLVGWPEA